MTKTYVEIINDNLDTLSKCPNMFEIIKNIEALNVIIFKFNKMPRNMRTQAIEFSPFVSESTNLEKDVLTLFKTYLKAVGKEQKVGSLKELFKIHMKTHDLFPVPTVDTYQLTTQFLNDLKNLTNKVTRSSEDILTPSLEHILNADNRKLTKCQFTKKEGYLACYVPIKVRNIQQKLQKTHQLSDHITVGYQEEEIEKYIHYLGQVVHVTLYNIVEWSDDNKKYAYIPAKLTFHDNAVKYSHISIHGPEPSWGTNYGANHVHQTENPQGEPKGEFKTLLCFFSRFHNDTKPLISCDLDKTLINSPEHAEGDLRFLTDPKQIKIELITEFGQFINDIGIPFTVTTSRRCNEDENLINKMTNAIKDVFPNCIDASYGSSIIARNEESRSEEKARCKSRRVKLIHYDDEEVVLKHVTGCMVTNTNTGFTLQTFLTYQNLVNVSNDHLKVMLIGPPGAGKTTLIADIIEHFETEKDRHIYYAATDSCEVNHDFVPDLSDFDKSCLLFDSTGDGRDVGREWSVISLCPKRTATDLLGTIKAILERKNHATLNGSNLTYIPTSVSDNTYTYHNKYNKNQMDIEMLVNTLYMYFKGRVEDLRSFFNLVNYDCKLTMLGDTAMLLIGYREGFQQWNANWGRQSRNIVLIQGKDKIFRILKAGLMAGSEIKPVDIGDSYRKKVSNIQQAIKDHLLTGKQLPENTVLTSKVDGCLLQITIVRDDVEHLFNTLSQTDTFNAMFMQKTYEHSKGSWFAIISTNGTLFVTEAMRTTIVTAFAASCNIVFNSTELLHDVWSRCIDSLSLRLDLYNNLTGHTCTETLQFEAVVPNRTPATFADYAMSTKHVELTIDYNRSILSFLGTRMGAAKYIPHFDLENIINMIGWAQPLFWKCNDSFTIAKMLDDLETVSVGQMTHPQYVNKWKPNNTNIDYNNITLDLEGFVMLMPFGDSYVYDKLKTIIYYIVHKPREHMLDYMKTIMDNDTTGNFLKYFPKIRTVIDLKTSLESLDITLDEVYNIVSKYEMSSDPKDYSKDTTPEDDLTQKMTKMKMAYNQKLKKPVDKGTIVKFITTNPHVFKQTNNPNGTTSPSVAIAQLVYHKLGKLDDVLNRQKDIENQMYRNKHEKETTISEFMNQYYHTISSLVNDVITNRNMERSKPLFVKKLTHNIISM